MANEEDVVAPLQAAPVAGPSRFCECTEWACYGDIGEYAVKDLCLHCHYLPWGAMCPARQAAELEDA